MCGRGTPKREPNEGKKKKNINPLGGGGERVTKNIIFPTRKKKKKKEEGGGIFVPIPKRRRNRGA